MRIQRELAERALRLEILGHELQHRINNVLATIHAIARRTRAKSQSLDEFAKAFDDRLAAIARTHALLSRTCTSTIDIREVLSQELSVHGAVEGENLKQRGPEISIPAKQAEALSMAIHELATNAVKHGALSAENGRIEIWWDVHDHDNENEFRLRWREWGSPISHAAVPAGLRFRVSREIGSTYAAREIRAKVRLRRNRMHHIVRVWCRIMNEVRRGPVLIAEDPLG